MFSSGKAEARTSGCDSSGVPPPPAFVYLARCYHKRCHHKKTIWRIILVNRIHTGNIIESATTVPPLQTTEAMYRTLTPIQMATGAWHYRCRRLAPAKPLPSMLPMLCYDVQWCRPFWPTKNELRAGMERCVLTPPTLSDADDARRRSRQTGDSISKLSVASSKSPDGSLRGRAHGCEW
jgi:hypothetical protein